MGEKIKVMLEDVNGVTGEILIDEDLLGFMDQELANDIASAVTWAVYGMIGNRKLKEAVKRLETQGTFLRTGALDG